MAIMTYTESSDNNMVPKKQVKKEIKELSYNFSPKILVEKEEFVTPAASNDSDQVTFQKALRLCILIGQFFGLNPVLGIDETDTSKLRFSVVSVRFIYTVCTAVGQCWIVLFCLMRTFKEENPSLGSNSNLVFYSTNTVTTFLFLRIATKWPKLCQQIAKLEEVDPNVENDVVKRCNVSCIIVLTCALCFFGSSLCDCGAEQMMDHLLFCPNLRATPVLLVKEGACKAFPLCQSACPNGQAFKYVENQAMFEHIMADLTGILAAIECQPQTPIFDAYCLGAFGWAWTFLDYNRVLAIWAVLLNVQCTFNWNFADVFVICISWYLTARLKQVNDKIIAVRGKYVADTFWRKMREDYCRATNLVRKVDSVINSVTFISFANNLFFICLQFLHVLEPMKGFENPLYFVFSFGFLLARYISVSLIAAKIHTASKLPVLSLYDVPSACYCTEVQRFIDQVHGDTVALSGLQFFHVKRGLLLTVAGTIVTYELVLMQFTGVNPTVAPNLGPLLLPPSVDLNLTSTNTTAIAVF